MLGLYPANLGWKRKEQNISLGLLGFTSSVFSEAPNKQNIINDLFDNSLSFNTEEKQRLAELFVSARLIGMISLTHFGIAYQDKKVGGIAFNIR